PGRAAHVDGVAIDFDVKGTAREMHDDICAGLGAGVVDRRGDDCARAGATGLGPAYAALEHVHVESARRSCADELDVDAAGHEGFNGGTELVALASSQPVEAHGVRIADVDEDE